MKKCRPKFGNLLTDSPDAIMRQIEIFRRKRVTGAAKNLQKIKNGQPVEEGIPAVLCIMSR